MRTAIGLWNKRVHPDLTAQKPFSPEKEEDESKKKDKGERKGSNHHAVIYLGAPSFKPRIFSFSFARLCSRVLLVVFGC